MSGGFFGGGAGGTVSPLTTKGDIWGYSSVDARLGIGTDGQVIQADSGEELGVKWGIPSSGETDAEIAIPLLQGVPEGVVGYPDVHDLVTASAHVSGSVMPDVTASIINFKTIHPIPDRLALTPAARVEFVIMTKGAVAGPQVIRLTVSSLFVADTESFDQAFTAETETSVTMPTATETCDVYSQALTIGGDPVAGDSVFVQLKRDPVDAADLFTDDIQIISATLFLARSLGAGIAGQIVHITDASGYASTNTKQWVFDNTRTNNGADMTLTHSATDGSYVTVNTAGTYAITMGMALTGVGFFGVTRNNTELTTDLTALTDVDQVLCIGTAPAANRTDVIGITLSLAATDVIRPGGNGTNPHATNSDRLSFFCITRVG